MYELCFLSNLTSTECAAWVQAIGSVVAILVSAGVAIWVFYRQTKAATKRDQRLRAERLRDCWMAVRAEVETCGNMARDFVAAQIGAPSWRLPTVAYDKILHELLLIAGLNTADTRDLLSFFTDVEALNRGLDIAQEMHNQGNQQRLTQQAGVNFNRATQHLQPGGDHYDAAIAVIERHTAKYRQA